MRIIDIVIKKIWNGKTGGTAAFFFALLLAFTLFSGRILSMSLNRGAENLRERLGADIAVVPEGQESNYQGIILSGEPVECSMKRDLESSILAIEGVEKVTPVIYLASLNASCCSVPIQIIGFDPKTDFVTSPWISDEYSADFGDGNLVIGANIATDEHNTLTFFGRTYDVKARLNKTGTGMDKSVYVTFDVMEQVIKDAKEKGVTFGNSGTESGFSENITDSYVSAFLVRIEDGYSTDAVAGSILRSVPAGVVQSKNLLSSVTNGIGYITNSIRIITLGMMVIVILVTAILHIYRITVRRKEWAVYRMMGAQGDWILRLILTETIFISVIGAIIGVGASALFVFPFSELIAEQIQLPYFKPDVSEVLGSVLFSIVLTALSAVIPGILAGDIASRTECYELMREGEL